MNLLNNGAQKFPEFCVRLQFSNYNSNCKMHRCRFVYLKAVQCTCTQSKKKQRTFIFVQEIHRQSQPQQQQQRT